MPVNYKGVPKKIPSKPGEQPLYYPTVVNSGSVSLRELAVYISEVCTLNTADTVACIEAVLQIMPKMLMDGKIVRLGEFGNFSLSVQGNGAEDVHKLSAHHINKVSVNFKAGTEFKHALKNTEFHKTY